MVVVEVVVEGSVPTRKEGSITVKEENSSQPALRLREVREDEPLSTLIVVIGEEREEESDAVKDELP